jgi:hypothetical protein
LKPGTSSKTDFSALSTRTSVGTSNASAGTAMVMLSTVVNVAAFPAGATNPHPSSVVNGPSCTMAATAPASLMICR